ncbi:MAG: trypsin-like peptidase domain-containing protein [Acidiferrobacterales bacterium]
MRFRGAVIFVAQTMTLGLAAAFVLTELWPGLIPHRTPAIQIIEAPPAPTPVRVNGPVSYAGAVDRAAPAVVNVNTARVVTVRPNPFFGDPLFQQFFGETGPLGTPNKRLETSLGSGVIISKQGYILTNRHVIAKADAIQVVLRDGRSAPAKVVGSDPDTDIAVLKVNLPRLPVITLGHSDHIRIGDVVLAIGNPFGVGQTVTMGIVSATGRSRLGVSRFDNFIQTDAPINPGNSGGALVDTDGDLIGINTLIVSQSGGSQGIGFAIPTSLAVNVMEQIIRYGRPLRAWLGIDAHALTPQIAEALGVKPTVRGIVVIGMVRGGPADKAGIHPGDIILSLDNKPLDDARQALLTISGKRPGDVAQMKILRNGRIIALSVIPTERPAQAARLE